MVKEPKYQAMDDARQKEIPKAFEKYCSKNFTLKEIPPLIENIPGPIPRPAFQVLDKDEAVIAYFHPWGNAKCYRDDFKIIFDQMVIDIEKAAQLALQDYEGH